MLHGCVTDTLACLRTSLNDMVDSTGFEWRITALKKLVRARYHQAKRRLEVRGAEALIRLKQAAGEPSLLLVKLLLICTILCNHYSSCVMFQCITIFRVLFNIKHSLFCPFQFLTDVMSHYSS